MNEDHPNIAPVPAPPAAAEGPLPGPEPAKHSPKRLLLVIAGALILVTATWLIVSMLSKTSAPGKSQVSTAQKLFDDMLTAAASQTKVQLTYAERGYDSKQGLENGAAKDQLYAVAEADMATKEYRAVYANQQGSDTSLTYYVVRRCLEGKMFKPDASALTYKTLEDVKSVLTQPFTLSVATDTSEGRDCSLADPARPGRLTDGIIPAGLDQDQIKGWLAKLHETDFVKAQDQGAATYNQKTVRKLHLVTNSLAGVSPFFDAVKKGAGLQLTTSKGTVGPDSYRLDHMATSDNINGFYLIDEQTKLPVYSEFTTASLLTEANKAGKVLRHVYQYPPSMTLGHTSTINTLDEEM